MTKTELTNRILEAIESTDFELSCPRVARPASLEAMTDNLIKVFSEFYKNEINSHVLNQIRSGNTENIKCKRPEFFTDW